MNGHVYAALRRPRLLNRAWAYVCRFFWIRCPRCGEMFGGHEFSRHAIETIGDQEFLVCWKHDDRPLLYIIQETNGTAAHNNTRIGGR